jgi:heme exporter protein B
LRFLHKVWTIVVKDITIEHRTREAISAMLVFAVLALLVFSFALDLRGKMARVAAPGVLWATVAFGGTLGLSRSLAREQQSGCTDGLLLAPIDRSAVFLGKAIGNLIFMTVVEVVLLPLLSVLLDVPLLQPGVLLVTALGTVGYAAAGTLLAALALNTRAQEILLPILLLPLAIPALIAAVQAIAGLVEGATLSGVGGWVCLRPDHRGGCDADVRIRDRGMSR